MFEQILLVSTLGNVKGAVRRICTLMLGSKELSATECRKTKTEGKYNEERKISLKELLVDLIPNSPN